MIATRFVAALVFLLGLAVLVVAHRRARERARVEEADGALREAFDRLDRDLDPGLDRHADDPARTS